MSSLVKFKFKYLGKNDKPIGLVSELGIIADEYLKMGDQKIPLDKVLLADRYPGHLVLRLDGQTEAMVVAFKGGNATKVLLTLNLRASAARAKLHRQQLSAVGMGNMFSCFLCPHCGFTVETSGHAATPQQYCPYCDTVTTLSDAPATYEGCYHLCGSCGMYGRVKNYTTLFVLFLIVFYYFKTERYCECRGCMKGRVWGNLGVNFPTLVGVPPALWQIARAYWPTSDPLSSLEAANRLVKKKRLQSAAMAYETIESGLTSCAIVRYNHAIALWAEGQTAEAVAKFELALADCANFLPACEHLASLYEALEMTDRLEAMNQTWSRAEVLQAGQAPT